jgi:secreted PhoX family phosphatase
VAVDPVTLRAYLTEDREDGCLYRFVPRDPARPFEGTLQALSVTGHPGLDTGPGLPGSGPLGVKWLPLPDDARDTDGLRYAARERGAALFRRGEGIVLAGSDLVFCATTGGRIEAGQVFRLTLGKGDEDRLDLLVEATDTRTLNMPDNVTVAPWGDVILAEDSPLGVKHLRVLSPDGALFDLARNATSRSEFAGVCFTPDGKTLFVNIYEGLTLAITGPFRGA